MRITCQATSCGNVFHFYRATGNFLAELRPLVPLLLKSAGTIEVGDDSNPDLLLTVGHMRAEAEAELVRRAKRFFEPGGELPH